ncbi:MAG: hypothetical protein HYW78_00770 [Parcubacteria group bacterium]|nr:hypothetical protein [Parcubacteria group bacterium]
MNKFSYFQRIIAAYIFKKPSQLTFWHEKLSINDDASYHVLGQYYMTFEDKARYGGPFDSNGIPLLNYHGEIGAQYNPIAIAHYGLAHFNIYKKTGDQSSFEKTKKQADWLVENLKPNIYGISVWHHYFDFDYDPPLRAPWYSGLAQGQGISLLLRVYQETKDDRYYQTALNASESFFKHIDEGGVLYVDEKNDIGLTRLDAIQGKSEERNKPYYTHTVLSTAAFDAEVRQRSKSYDKWIEEYIVSPPTHILNGFIWGLWGIYDLWLFTKENKYKNLFDDSIATLLKNIHRYDNGFWSLYQLKHKKLLRMLASPFYHRLHIIQLKILYKMTSAQLFLEYAERWKRYQKNIFNRTYALLYKSIFKLIYY